MGSSCLDTAFVMGCRRLPLPPASMIPFMSFPSQAEALAPVGAVKDGFGPSTVFEVPSDGLADAGLEGLQWLPAEFALYLSGVDEMEQNFEKRKKVWLEYEKLLNSSFQMQKANPDSTQNYAYFPVLFRSEEALLRTMDELQKNNIKPRRYFYPSLDTVPCFREGDSPISREIAKKILCLPIYTSLLTETITMVVRIIEKVLKGE
jgi:hypothetical protein